MNRTHHHATSCACRIVRNSLRGRVVPRLVLLTSSEDVREVREGCGIGVARRIHLHGFRVESPGWADHFREAVRRRCPPLPGFSGGCGVQWG